MEDRSTLPSTAEPQGDTEPLRDRSEGPAAAGGRRAIPTDLLDMLTSCSDENLELVRSFVKQLQESTEAIEARLLDVLRDVDASERCGDVIPLDLVRPRFEGIPRQILDATLLGMERRSMLELKVARVLRGRRAAHGIPSERGLLFFIVLR